MIAASGPTTPMNLRAYSVVQRSYFVFVITGSCDGQAHSKPPIQFSVPFLNPPGVLWAQSSYPCGTCRWALRQKTHFPRFPISSLSHWARWRQRSFWIYSTDTAWCQIGPQATRSLRYTQIGRPRREERQYSFFSGGVCC